MAQILNLDPTNIEQYPLTPWSFGNFLISDHTFTCDLISQACDPWDSPKSQYPGSLTPSYTIFQHSSPPLFGVATPFIHIS